MFCAVGIAKGTGWFLLPSRRALCLWGLGRQEGSCKGALHIWVVLIWGLDRVGSNGLIGLWLWNIPGLIWVRFSIWQMKERSIVHQFVFALRHGGVRERLKAVEGIRYLVSNPDNKKAVRDAGGMEALVEKLDNSQDSPLTIVIAETITCLIADDDASRVSCFRRSILLLAMMAMERILALWRCISALLLKQSILN